MDEIMDGRLSAHECSESLLMLSGSYGDGGLLDGRKTACWR